MVDLSKLKEGDYIMQDGGGVAYATFAKISGIEKSKERIVISLRDVYKRKKVNLYPREKDVFTYDYSDRLHLPTTQDMTFRNLYIIKKSQFTAIEKAYDKYTKIFEQICNTFTKMYFQTKRK